MARVLLINDEPDLLTVCQIVLETDGHSVVATTDPRRAVELASAGADLVIVDLVMPHASGEDVVRRLAERDDTRGIPIVVMSALPDVEERARAIHADDFLGKPFTPTGLIDTVRRTLARAHRRNDAQRLGRGH